MKAEGEEGDATIGWHHQLNGRELGQIPGDGEGQGSLVCCSPWRCKELDLNWQLKKEIVFRSLGHRNKCIYVCTLFEQCLVRCEHSVSISSFNSGFPRFSENSGILFSQVRLCAFLCRLLTGVLPSTTPFSRLVVFQDMCIFLL